MSDARQQCADLNEDDFQPPTNEAGSGVNDFQIVNGASGSYDGPGFDGNGQDARKQEDPDVLRWRAEMLLDEMMVGAVDASAGEWSGNVPREAAREAREVVQRVTDLTSSLEMDSRRKAHGATPANTPNNGSSGAPGADNVTDSALNHPAADPTEGLSVSAAKPAHRKPTPVAQAPNTSASNQSPSAASEPPIVSRLGSEPPTSKPGSTVPNGAAPSATNGAPNARLPYIPSSKSSLGIASPSDAIGTSNAASAVNSAAKAPRRISGNVEGNGAHSVQANGEVQPVFPAPSLAPSRGAETAWAPAPGIAAQPSATSASSYRDPYESDPYEFASSEDVASRRITSVEQRYAKSENVNEAPSKSAGLAASATSGAVLSEGTHADREAEMGPTVPALGPIRRNAAVIAGAGAVAAMSVGATNSRYNNLLPRSAPWDTHETARELATLAEEMARVLPGHHESTRRARHLLEKAQTIFAASPERSAEVDYYLAQVRSIVQRSRQTLQWSNLYRKRLMLYYSAWLLLSVIMVAGGFLFGSAWGDALAALFGWDPNGFLALNAIPALVAMFSGSMGGSLGGIWNLQRYYSQGLGFIDRKFSLRGLVLPLMGLLTGFILYAIAAGISWALAPGTPPSPLLWFIPALLAFAFGLLQETIYGTRD